MTKKSAKVLKANEYRLKRERNNISVKKSREKSRLKAQMVSEKVEKLKDENASLEMTVTLLSKEIDVIRGLLLSQGKSEREAAYFKSDHEYSSKEVPERV